MKLKIDIKILVNIILGIIFIVALSCGIVGWQQYYLDENQHISFWGALYLTFQLIGKSTSQLINNGAYPPRVNVPTFLEISRLLMPLVILSAMINIILAMTKKQIDLLLIKYIYRDHYVFCGLNKKTESLVKDILKNVKKGKDLHSGDRVRIVVIEKKPDHKLISSIKRRNVKVIIGDARDIKVLKQANTGNSSYVSTFINDDAVNFEIIDKIKSLKEKLFHRRIKVITQLSDFYNITLAKDYQQIESRFIDFHAFCFFQKTAQKIIDKYSPDIILPVRNNNDPAARILIYGLTLVGENLLIEAGQMYHFANLKKTRVTVVDYNIKEKLDLILRKYPGLFDVIDLDAIEPEVLFDLKNPYNIDNLSVCFVTTDNDSECIMTSLRCRQFFYSRQKNMELPRIITILTQPNQISSLISNRETKLTDIKIEVHDLHEYFDKVTIMDDKEAIDIAAEQVFNIYPDKENRKFESLTDREKDMNRFPARHLLIKFRYLNLPVEENYRKLFDSVRKNQIPVTAAQSDILCRMEHNRWCAEKLLTGFVPGVAVQDKTLKNTLKNSLKCHPLICDFDQLDVSEQAKDLGPFFQILT